MSPAPAGPKPGMLIGSPSPLQCPDVQVSLTGHSMGGHGALTIGLKNPGAYKSLSAFSPICNPSTVPWGIKAFSGYLGEDREAWKQVQTWGNFSTLLQRSACGSLWWRRGKDGCMWWRRGKDGSAWWRRGKGGNGNLKCVQMEAQARAMRRGENPTAGHRLVHASPQYDATELAKAYDGPSQSVLIDQGAPCFPAGTATASVRCQGVVVDQG